MDRRSRAERSGAFGALVIRPAHRAAGVWRLLGGSLQSPLRFASCSAIVLPAPALIHPSHATSLPFRARSPSLPQSLVDAAVRRAVNKWGEKSIQALEAEDRLSLACEKGPLEDDVLLGLRVAFEEVLGEYKKVTDEERNEVRALGGLHVVGTERHESRRIDNQLRGRAGRQGDPGSTRFFLSLEDNLFRIFGGDRVQALMQAFRVEDLPIESSMLSSSLDEAQKKVETYFYDIRKQLFEYDQVLNSQREKVYAERRKALRSDQAELSALMVEYAELTIDDICAANLDQSADQSTWDFEALDRKLKQYCPQMADLTPAELKAKASAGGFEGLRGFLRERGKTAYMEKAGYVEGRQAGLMAEAERYFILSQTDSLWKEHLQAIKFVQQAVGLRGYAQRDPLIEYKLEGYNLFVEMMAQIRRNVIYSVLMFEFKRRATSSHRLAAPAWQQQQGGGCARWKVCIECVCACACFPWAGELQCWRTFLFGC